MHNTIGIKRGRSCLTTTVPALPATPCCDVAAASAPASSSGVPAADARSDAEPALCAAADATSGVAVNAETGDVSEFGDIKDDEPLTVGAGDGVPSM